MQDQHVLRAVTSHHSTGALAGCLATRGKRLHTRNRHLRNQCGFSVACSTGFRVACSNIISLVCGSFQRIVTFPVDFHWNCPMAFQWHFPMDAHFCDFRCVIFCPERPSRSRQGASQLCARELRGSQGRGFDHRST